MTLLEERLLFHFRMIKILIAETTNFNQQVVSILKQYAVVDMIEINQEQVAYVLNNYDVFWFRLRFNINSKLINFTQKCKFIVCPVTGLDHIDLEACDKKGIKVISLKGELEFLKKVRATAELTLGLTLALIRKIPDAVNNTKLGLWDREPFLGKEIFEKKIGILGFGRLGQITASYFFNLGAQVFIYDIKNINSDDFTVVKDINELFSTCDIVSVHVNLTDSNYHFIGIEQFNVMKKGSYFVNTSRGQLVNSNDLIYALEKGYLAGAAIDVIENEFNNENDELLKYCQTHNNLIITPHIGGSTYESFEKTEMFLAEKLVELIK